jgi:lipopolysaccharide export system permease protein
MRTLDRYIASQFIRLFLLFTLATPLLFVLGDLTDNLDRFHMQGLSTGQIALNYVYQMPQFISWAFPIAALIAAVFTVNGMTRHSEVAAAKASGISFHRLFAALPILGVILTAGGLVLSELVPVANQARAQIVGPRQPVSNTRENFVYRADDGEVYMIRRVIPDLKRIYGVMVEREGDEPKTPGMEIMAEQAVYDGSRGWIFASGTLRMFYGPGQTRTVDFQQLREPQFRVAPQDLLARPKEPDQMRYAELRHFIQVLRRSGGKPLDLEVEQAQRISLPLATLVIILFAAPLATSSRRGGAAYGAGISLTITIIYLMLFKVAGAAGQAGDLPPLLAAWVPNILFAAAAVLLLRRVRT